MSKDIVSLCLVITMTQTLTQTETQDKKTHPWDKHVIPECGNDLRDEKSADFTTISTPTLKIITWFERYVGIFI